MKEKLMQEAHPASGVIAIVRLRARHSLDEIVEALLLGGVRSVEITIETPGGLEAVSRWRDRGDASLGVGTVRTSQNARRAIEAGAGFLVTPTVIPPVLEVAAGARVPIVAGALSPTEIDMAWQQGASAVKVFPAAPLGGPAYIRAVQDPLPDVRLVPTGGVDADVARTYAAMGCAGVGVGSALVDERVAAVEDRAELRRRAEILTAA